MRAEKEGILFLDKFNCASEILRPVMLQLLQGKTFGPHAIPDGWMLVLAGNQAEYNTSAKALDAVTADRMRLLWLRPGYTAWRAYMVEMGIHPIVLTYLDDQKQQFYVFEKGSDGTGLVTARGWEELSVMLWLMEEQRFAIDLPFVAQYLRSAQVAREFMVCYTQYDKIIKSGIIMNGENWDAAAEEVEEMSFAQKWALISVLLLRQENLCAEHDRSMEKDMLVAIEYVIGFYNEYFVGEPQ